MEKRKFEEKKKKEMLLRNNQWNLSFEDFWIRALLLYKWENKKNQHLFQKWTSITHHRTRKKKKVL